MMAMPTMRPYFPAGPAGTVYRMPIVMGTSFTNSGDRYISVGGTAVQTTVLANAEALWPSAGTLKSLRFYIRSNAATNPATFRLIKNGVATSATITVSTGTTGLVEDSANAVTVAAGDLICFEIVRGDINNIVIESATIDFVTTTGSMVHIANSNSGSMTGGGTINYIRLSGTSVNRTTTGDVEFVAPCALTFKNLAIYISANTRTTNNTFRLEVNGSASVLTLSIPFGTTGWFSNNANTVTVAAGDIVRLRFANGGSGGGITQRTCIVETVGATDGVNAMFMGRDTIDFPTASSPVYFQLFSNQLVNSAGTVEADNNLQIRGAGTIKNMYVLGAFNTADADVVYTTRKGGASQSLAVTVPALTNGTFSDTTDTVSYVNNDSLALMVTRTGLGTHAPSAVSYEINPTIEAL
jgi:hypothetical protein